MSQFGLTTDRCHGHGPVARPRRHCPELRWFWKVVVCTFTVWDFCLALCASRSVRTLSGVVSGVVVTLQHEDLGAVEVFRGVPYAAPPVRFSPPHAGQPWSGVRPATRSAPACPQPLPDLSNETALLRQLPRGRLEQLKRAAPLLRHQSEDCLYLDIYTPLPSTSATRYPVLVFVPGEGFQRGSAHMYDGSVLSSYGRLVVVTLNYRLGLLGFLSAGHIQRSAANFGLLDQISALRWVQDNIQFFGGDPGSVTLVGHGSGAACVHWLVNSPAVPPGRLFHRAVLMSGSAASARSLVTDPQVGAQTVARLAACPLNHRLLHCLRQRPLEALVTPLKTARFSTVFGPSRDGVVIDGDQFGDGVENVHSRRASYQFASHEGVDSLTLKHKKTAKYDLLLGVVKAEAFSYFSEEDILYGIENDKKIQILQSFVNSTYRYHQSEILATLVNEYTSWERPVQHPANILQETMEALSDGMQVAPLIHAADRHSGGSYLYVFGHQTRAGDFPQKHGCVHGEELAYVFGAPLDSRLPLFTRNFSKAEALLSQTVMTYWANFAATGNPNKGREMRHHSERHRAHEKWLPYDRVHKRYLALDTKPKMRNHYRAHRLSFWLNLVPQLHRGADVPPSHHQLTGTIS